MIITGVAWVTPKILKKIIDIQLKASNTTLNYPFKFVPTNDDEKRLILELPECLVYSLPLLHKVTTTGFLFEEKVEPRQLNIAKIAKYDIEKSNLKLLKQGLDIVDKRGKQLKNSTLTVKGKSPRKYAFCSDTMYYQPLVEQLKNVDLLYHEATFLQEHLQRALETKHSTALQAAQIAKKAKVKKLLLGHFSSRYIDLSVLLNEAKPVFDNVELAIEGEIFKV